jgi:glycosyltransferase involved in cell wall biosynthesis
MNTRVVRNDWSAVTPPGLNGWQPSETVSVVIPALADQHVLDLTLAALSGQTYPAELLEVTVVDDGSDPPLRLPEIRPERTKLIRVSEGWGKANALREGVAHSSGAILHLLDADMLVYPEHVAALARWHHVLPYAVTLGYKRFVDGPVPSAQRVADAWRAGTAAELFGGNRGEPHEYQERYITQTDQLRTADHLAFRIFVGATVGLRRELFDVAGGPNPALRFGNDTEFGYRLAQAGAVFIPEPLAQSWHLGPTHVMRAQAEIARYRLAFLADLVPYPRHWRKAGGTAWTVPLVEVVMIVDDEPLERVRAAVDSVLRGAERDVRVNLVGPWDQLDRGRVPALTDPQLELRLIAATYRGEPRVRLVTEPVESAFPSPYLLELPAAYAIAPDSLARLLSVADRHAAGVVRVGGDSGPKSGSAGGARSEVLFWRTAARGRARWVSAPGDSMIDAVASVHDRRDVTSEEVGLIDLTQFTPCELGSGLVDVSTRHPSRRPGLVPAMVEVEGIRSLARATVVVAWLTGRRLRTWVRRRMRRPSSAG